MARSGYNVTGFNDLDPMDPNDRVRQKTQSRPDEFPYDRPVTYGRPRGIGTDGSEYVREPSSSPPVPQHRRPEDEVPKSVWEELEESLSLGTYEPGPNAPDALALGYGNRGRMGDGVDPYELELDVLRQQFKDSFVDTLPQAQDLGRSGLFHLLVQLDPDYSAELFGPDDDDEAFDIYTDWGQHVYAPGAEEDLE